jgi:hypothetical protein
VDVFEVKTALAFIPQEGQSDGLSLMGFDDIGISFFLLEVEAQGRNL